MRHVCAQGVPHGLSVTPRLHRQHLNALGQQHGGLALHLHPVLQVFNHLDAVSQLVFKRGQRLFGQRRARLRGVALPGQGIGNIELGDGQQRLGFGGPFTRHDFLALGTFDLVELFAQQLGCTLVAPAKLLEDFLQLLRARAFGQPFTNPRRALP